MVVESHKNNRGDLCLQKIKAEMDKELSEIQAEIERIAFKMQQEVKVHWRYEWPLKRTAKWYVGRFLASRQQQVLKRWLRYAKNLNGKGKISGSILVGCQKGNEEEPSDLINFQEGRGDILN
jgi:hypothetical protein